MDLGRFGNPTIKGEGGLRRNGACGVSDLIEKEKQSDQEEGETQPEAKALFA